MVNTTRQEDDQLMLIKTITKVNRTTEPFKKPWNIYTPGTNHNFFVKAKKQINFLKYIYLDLIVTII